MTSYYAEETEHSHMSNIVSESQCRFFRSRSTVDVVLSLKKVQEKFTKQNNMSLCAMFIDFRKVLETVHEWKEFGKCLTNLDVQDRCDPDEVSP